MCKKGVGKKGRSRSDRLIFDMYGTVHLLLYQYVCTSKSQEMHKRDDGQYKLSISDDIRHTCYSDTTLTHRSGYTSSLLHC